MKVAFILRPDLYKNPGGDTVQAINTAKALEMLGIPVDICLSGQEIKYGNYDLLHLFNMIDCEDLLGHVFACDKPYVVSTVYVDYREYDRKHGGGLIGILSTLLTYDQVEFLKTIGKFLLRGEKVSSWKYFIYGHRGSIKEILNRAGCLIPNSESEMRRIEKDYGIRKPYIVAPNGADARLFRDNESEKRDTVLCVGRIEGRKNQLNLIRAMNDTGITTILIGKPSSNQKKYYDQCRKEAGSNIVFIDHLPQHELLKYYSSCKVHVLPSWFETTGLVTLEAGLMGCNVVVGDRGDVRDYFGDMAWYCEPDSVDDIRKKVVEAFESPINTRLKTHICDHYTWELAARETLKAYRALL